MLGVSHYDKQYIDDCRAAIERQLAAYDGLLEAVKAGNQGGECLRNAIAAFERDFLSNLVLALDHHFIHRLRNLELKDGNPLNEVRMLANSIMAGNGALQRDSTIKYDPAKSVLEYKIGDEIRLSPDDFTRLAKAFLGEIARKYP